MSGTCAFPSPEESKASTFFPSKLRNSRNSFRELRRAEKIVIGVRDSLSRPKLA
jgi:hypothetical protein